MFDKSDIANLEKKYQRTYGLDDNTEDVRIIIEHAVYAAEQYSGLEKPLRCWLEGMQIFGDVKFENGASLMKTAELLCEEEPDIPLACWLMYLHLSGECPGIISVAGELCMADRAIFEENEPVYTAFKTEDGWGFLGKSAAASEQSSPEYEWCELWQIMERFPKMLPLIAYPFFTEGTVICREDDHYTVQCPADEEFTE